MLTLTITPKPAAQAAASLQNTCPDGTPPATTAVSEPKTRSFTVALLGYATAETLWDGKAGNARHQHPIWFVATGTESALRPFVMNMIDGRAADLRDTAVASAPGTASERFELARCATYEAVWRRAPTNAGDLARRMADDDDAPVWSVLLYARELCVLDPGLLDPEGCRFSALTPDWWALKAISQLQTGHADQVAAVVAHARRLGVCEGGMATGLFPDGFALSPDEVLEVVPMAARFTAYLERRVRRPIPNGLPFAMHCYLAALRDGLASRCHLTIRSDRWPWARHDWARSFIERKVIDAGMRPGTIFKATHARLDRFLAVESQRYLALERGETVLRIAA
jgi:hypothetical protein